jgi:uncharacterized protein with ParB-like and HNH nuclease domain
MARIQSKAKTVRELLDTVKYSIDYYQREYKWKQKQVSDLIEDLSIDFLQYYEEGHDREEVENYGHYFLGSIIINNKNGQRYIVDGQQRLTTLTLLFIYLYHLQKEREDKVPLRDLIYSEKYSKKSFNIQIEERTKCMKALLEEGEYETNEDPISVKNIMDRYHDIEIKFPEELKEEALPYFIDWLIENVQLVEINTTTDEDAYTIFETMNDRGLSLAPADMLKGYLLANIENEDQRWHINDTWKKTIEDIRSIDNKEIPDFFKAWLRGQYAQSTRKRKKNAAAKDFERIGTEFHRWVREKRNQLGLIDSSDFQDLIQKEMVYFADQYQKIRKHSDSFHEDLPELFYISQFGFTLQYPLLLSAFDLNDNQETIHKKIRLVCTYLDIVLARRWWNWHSISYSTMSYRIFLDMVEIRRKPVKEITDYFIDKINEEDEDFYTNDRYALHGTNRRHIRMFLTRFVDYIERQSGQPSNYLEYVNTRGKNRYEVEHIWANHPERFVGEGNQFGHVTEFADYRNHIGGLLLLPKTFNASYGDDLYKEKLKHYYGQNILAASLHPLCYEKNPGFLSFVKESELPFKPHPEFTQKDLDVRQKLYTELAARIWDPKRLENILDE